MILRTKRTAGDSRRTKPVKIGLRPARPIDYGFARQLYSATMRDLVEEAFGWNEYHQDAVFARQFVLSEVHIVTLSGRDVGWIQTQRSERTIKLGQFYIAPEHQGRGIGSTVLERLLGEARKQGKDVTLSVMKANPALDFYRRRGFRLSHEDRYKFYLRYQPRHPLRGIGPSMGLRRG
jgi:GNAT superfamily N-acetyltransferase